ncbi:unnamed protein product [Closterium sp. Yama58-4]|nr:unnamed protein product [Closterium sp. Yama58-4]
MARALSVALAIFVGAILALSFAQATSAEAAGVVTAENAASTALLEEVPREAQRHRKLIESFGDASSCQAERAVKVQRCYSVYKNYPTAAANCARNVLGMNFCPGDSQSPQDGAQGPHL